MFRGDISTVNSYRKPSSITESVSGPYMTIPFPSQKERNQRDREGSLSGKPIETSSLEKTLFERMTAAGLNLSQQTKISESGTPSLDPDPLQAPPERKPLLHWLQSQPLLQQLQPPPLPQEFQPSAFPN
jgi:hypothetical protein